MNSDSKSHAIFCVTFGVGVLGTMLVGWPAIIAAAIAISAIALAPSTEGADREQGEG